MHEHRADRLAGDMELPRRVRIQRIKHDGHDFDVVLDSDGMHAGMEAIGTDRTVERNGWIASAEPTDGDGGTDAPRENQ